MSRNWYGNWLVIMTVMVSLSWLVYSYPQFTWPVLISVLVIVFSAACYRLEYGVAAVLAELVVGSQGHLIGQLRLGLFLVVLLASVVWMVRERSIAFLHTRYWKWYLAMVCVFGVAVLTAIWHGNTLTNIFLDLNGYLFIGLILAFSQAIRTPADLKKLFAVFWAGVTMLVAETVVILFLFSHQAAFQYYLPEVYRWLRDFRLAEITMQDNNFTRIFFQSQLYVLFGFTAASLQFITKQAQRFTTVLAIGATLVLLFISYSRSFWVATLGIIIILLILAYQQKIFWKYCITLGVAGSLGCVIILGIINVPLWGSGAAVDASSLLTERTNDLTGDIGGGSRLALLKPLTLAALQRPLLGSGFGSTVTYQTKDPRALAETETGWYTTYAFEWGYLDLWLKLGLVGLIVYGSILVALTVRLWYDRQQLFAFTACLGVIAVGIVHLFTPYLNHPLGLGWVILATTIASVYDATNR